MHMIKSIVQYDQRNQPQGKENKSIIQGRDSMFRLFCLGYEFTQFHPLFTLPKHNLDSRKKINGSKNKNHTKVMEMRLEKTLNK